MKRPAVAAVLFAIMSACGGSADVDEPGAVGCSDEDRGQTLVCEPGEVCCAVSDGDNFCASSCDDGSVTFACDDREDCDGSACCHASGGAGVGSSCSHDVECTSPGQPTCETSSECPADIPCCISATINGVRVRFCGTYDGCT